MEAISSPYNFVPLSQHVVSPDWAERVRHDVPFSDGICGTIELAIIADTPVFVRDPLNREQSYRLPDGKHAIPGTSLRGMLRNVVEIAFFGKMRHVTERRYGVRDLDNAALYRDYMAEIRAVTGGPSPASKKEKQPVPLVSAGWLERRGDEWIIRACHFAKVSYERLHALAEQRGRAAFDPGKKQSAADKYEAWGEAQRTVRFGHKVIRTRDGVSTKAIPWFSEVGEVTALGEGPTEGVLVFTGQPQRYELGNPDKRNKKNKHHDFVFYGDAERELRVSEAQRKDFELIHSDSGQQGRLDVGRPNREWGYWKARFDKGERVPVFFILDKQKNLRSFGLAMMFRLAYRSSPADLASRLQRSDGADLSDLLFGYVRRRGATTEAVRGRVSIETAVAEGDVKLLPMVEGVLASPKPTYYPSYVRQSGYEKGKAGAVYKTYMDDDALLRGWKRYQVRTTVRPLPRNEDNRNLHTRFQPLPVGTRFATRVHLHNLRPAELGALLWALDFGGHSECRHSLGLAKAFGYGAVRLEVKGAELFDVRGHAREWSRTREEALAAVRELMNGEEHEDIAGDWEGSEALHDLRALATPAGPDRDGELRHMRLNGGPDGKTNEFVEAKRLANSLKPPFSPKRGELVKRRAELRTAFAAGEKKREELRKAEAKQREEEEKERTRQEAFASSEEEGLRYELDDAIREKRHRSLLLSWMQTEGEANASRRRVAHDAWKSGKLQIAKGWRKVKPDLVKWIKGE